MEDLDLLGAEYVGGPADNAIAAGNRDENALTDLEFNARHPERKGAPIKPSEKNLTKEWVNLRNTVVRPALNKAKLPTAPPEALAREAAMEQQGPAPAVPSFTPVPVNIMMNPALPAAAMASAATQAATAGLPPAPPALDLSSALSWLTPAAPAPAAASAQAAPAQASASERWLPPALEELPLGVKVGGAAVLVYALSRLLGRS